jgi:hypothetical protein
MTIRSSKFTQYKDIEGMDPSQVPLWKFLYQGLHNNWLRRIAHERESYVIPIDNIGTTVFVAELVTANFDLAILTVSLLTDRNQGTNLHRKSTSRWPRILLSRSNPGFHPQ